jgi:hypothetical protein
MIKFFAKDIGRFSDSPIFVYLIYVANFFRDVVPMVLEIVLSIILIYFLNKFGTVYAGDQLSQNQKALRKLEKTNLIISFIICILSVFSHSITYSVRSLDLKILNRIESDCIFNP